MTTTTRPLRLAVIVGSTREGRFGPTVVEWIADRAREDGRFEVDVIDPLELDLPAHHPGSATPAVRSLRERIERADAFVIVTPEYNHSYPASLKHTLDLAKKEWARKAAGFVSYAGMSGGLRAVEALRPVLGAFDLHGVVETVSFHGLKDAFGEDGQPNDPGADEAADRLLSAIAWWGWALRTAREADRLEIVAA